MKKNAKNLIYDKLHRGFVWTSIAVTLGGSVFLGFQIYNYFMFVKPQRQQLQIEREQQLLSEGMDESSKNEQLRM